MKVDWRRFGRDSGAPCVGTTLPNLTLTWLVVNWDIREYNANTRYGRSKDAV
jgi:hypothetical protein